VADNIIKQTDKGLMNEQRTPRERGSTFMEHTHDESGGRFAKQIPQTVVGSTPSAAALYPAGPTWSQDVAPIEPPLGTSVEDHEAVGTYQEIEASIDRLGATDLLPGPPDGGDAQRGCTEVSGSAASQSQPSPPITTPRAVRRGALKRRKRGSK
jgi:hypothetical protein